MSIEVIIKNGNEIIGSMTFMNNKTHPNGPTYKNYTAALVDRDGVKQVWVHNHNCDTGFWPLIKRAILNIERGHELGTTTKNKVIIEG